MSALQDLNCVLKCLAGLFYSNFSISTTEKVSFIRFTLLAGRLVTLRQSRAGVHWAWQWLSAVIGHEVQVQQKPWSCRGTVTSWHLCDYFPPAGRPDVKHLGQDITRLYSPLLSLVTTLPAATSNNTAVSTEETAVTCHTSASRAAVEMERESLQE